MATAGARTPTRALQIIAAAKACFADHGYNNTTNKMIAAAAGVVPGLIYYYFDSKEQLFISVFEHMYQRRDERLADFDFTEHSLRENLARMLDDSVHLALDDSSFVEVFELSGREVSRNPALAKAWEAHWQRVVHVWSRSSTLRSSAARWRRRIVTGWSTSSWRGSAAS